MPPQCRSALAALLVSLAVALPATAASFRDRPPEDEVVYFVLPDRFENADPANDQGGYDGDRLDHGFDPTHKGFYNGGDLKGLTERLDYIRGLGATAIWLGPIYKNKPVQGGAGNESAGYHGYWITDFTAVDPHFGTKENLRAFVDGAHARGMKIYLDIITNHTADVIAYRECHDPGFDPGRKVSEECPYRSKADYPYTTQGAADGPRINPGFLGDAAAFQTVENFAKLTRFDYAYTPFVPEAEKGIKKPAWLNDIRYYHNRGNTTFEGENSLYGDFVGLDDLMTEDPAVVQGFIDIYKSWITEFKVDGFRIDTARHVNPEFWRAFNPAMIEHARSLGIPNFYVFGEVFDPSPLRLAHATRVDGFPTVLDFAFQSALSDVLVRGAPSRRFEALFVADDLYEGGAATARTLPVFIGNHDMGRFSGFLRAQSPDMSDDVLFSKVRLAHALMFFARGVPVIYYGDEQGFVSDGNDQDARETLFPSQVDIYNDNDLIATTATTADANFDTEHPLYRAIAGMAAVYKAHEPLRRGRQKVRLTEKEGGLLALSRLDDETGREYLVVFNTGDTDRKAQIEVGPRSLRWESVHGGCAAEASAPTSYAVSVKALDYVICRAMP